MLHLFSSTFLPTTLNTKLIKGTLDLKRNKKYVKRHMSRVCSKIKEKSEASQSRLIQSISQCAMYGWWAVAE